MPPVEAASVDWEAISDRGRWTLRHVVLLLACGYHELEIARFYGEKRTWVRARVDELRTELEGPSRG